MMLRHGLHHGLRHGLRQSLRQSGRPLPQCVRALHGGGAEPVPTMTSTAVALVGGVVVAGALAMIQRGDPDEARGGLLVDGCCIAWAAACWPANLLCAAAPPSSYESRLWDLKRVLGTLPPRDPVRLAAELTDVQLQYLTSRRFDSAIAYTEERAAQSLEHLHVLKKGVDRELMRVAPMRYLWRETRVLEACAALSALTGAAVICATDGTSGAPTERKPMQDGGGCRPPAADCRDARPWSTGRKLWPQWLQQRLRQIVHRARTWGPLFVFVNTVHLGVQLSIYKKPKDR